MIPKKLHSSKILWTLLKMDKGGTQIAQRTRKLMMMHMALHLRDDIDFVSSKEGGRGQSRLMKYTKITKERLIATTNKKQCQPKDKQ